MSLPVKLSNKNTNTLTTTSFTTLSHDSFMLDANVSWVASDVGCIYAFFHTNLNIMSQILFSHSYIFMELLAPHTDMCCQAVESSTGQPAVQYT